MVGYWKPGIRLCVKACLAGCLCILAAGCGRPPSHGVSFEPERDEVAAALAGIAPGGGAVFINQAAAGWFEQAAIKGWSLDETGPSERLRAGVDPEFWRSRDRAARHAAAGFLGEPGDARPLMRHLLGSPDWRLAWVGGSGCLFARPDANDRGAPPALGDPSARTAHWLIEAGLTDEAANMIAGLRGSDDTGHIAFLETWLAAEARDWDSVLERAARADDGPFSDAVQALRARAHLERGEAKAAWRATRGLAARSDADASLLFLHARACRAAHAWDDEAATLRRVIALMEEAGAPTAAYKVYLGQALSSAGRSTEALHVFREASADPKLPDGQREFVETALRRLDQK